jgi:hypothetical protein
VWAEEKWPGSLTDVFTVHDTTRCAHCFLLHINKWDRDIVTAFLVQRIFQKWNASQTFMEPQSTSGGSGSH